MSDQNRPQEHNSLSMMYGTYATVLFVLSPVLVIAMQRLCDAKVYETLMRADLGIAATIMAGLAIGNFVLGLVTNRDLGRYKERIVFFIALTLFVVLGPSIILMLSIVGNAEVPGFVAFVQPVLLIVAISLFTTAVSISNILVREGATGSEVTGNRPAGVREQGHPGPAPLELPRKTGNDSF